MHGPDDDGPAERIRAALDILWQSPTGAHALCGSCGNEITACARLSGCPDWSRVEREIARRQIDLTMHNDDRHPRTDVGIDTFREALAAPPANRHARRKARALARRHR